MCLEEVYHMAPMSPNMDFQDPNMHPPSGMFDASDVDGDLPFSHSHHWNEPLIPVYMNPITHKTSIESECLQ